MRSAALVIGFKRPEHLRRVLDRVSDATRSRVFIAIDGPRHDGEAEQVRACAQVAREFAGLASSTRLRLRDTNLGCQRGVIDAVSWFLDEESEGVIVEDDSVPAASFFPFCDELLQRYRRDQRVLAIAGESRVPQSRVSHLDSYRFSYMGPAGAWATWADRWSSFTSTRLDQSPLAAFRALAGSRHGGVGQRIHWSALIAANRTRVMDSWAYPFMVEGLATGRLTATPNVNLVADHGVGDDARHMQGADPLNQAVGELTFPLVHPEAVVVDERAEAWSDEFEVGFGARALCRNAAVFSRRLVGR